MIGTRYDRLADRLTLLRSPHHSYRLRLWPSWRSGMPLTKIIIQPWLETRTPWKLLTGLSKTRAVKALIAAVEPFDLSTVTWGRITRKRSLRATSVRFVDQAATLLDNPLKAAPTPNRA